MRCNQCARAWPKACFITDFGNGLVIECHPNNVEIRFVEWEDGVPTVRERAIITQAELQRALDQAYGVDR